MSHFDIKQDLEGRPAAQSLEILAISGPHCDWVMSALKAGDYTRVEERFPVTVNAEDAQAIVARYGAMFGVHCSVCGEQASSTGSLAGRTHRWGPTGHEFTPEG